MIKKMFLHILFNPSTVPHLGRKWCHRLKDAPLFNKSAVKNISFIFTVHSLTAAFGEFWTRIVWPIDVFCFPLSIHFLLTLACRFKRLRIVIAAAHDDLFSRFLVAHDSGSSIYVSIWSYTNREDVHYHWIPQSRLSHSVLEIVLYKF